VNEDPYVYPGTSILRNRLGVTNQDDLERIERELVAQRITEGTPLGGFDLAHLQAIHRHLLQDVYDWAGQIRTVEIAKGGKPFIHHRFIRTGMADVHQRIERAGFLKNLTQAEFARIGSEIIGDVNYIHPFREGNGRTQLLYLEQLAQQATHAIDLTRLDPARWIEASRAAWNGDFRKMERQIVVCMAKRSRRTPPRG
jgi:cell filamentation protein